MNTIQIAYITQTMAMCLHDDGFQKEGLNWGNHCTRSTLTLHQCRRFNVAEFEACRKYTTKLITTTTTTVCEKKENEKS